MNKNTIKTSIIALGIAGILTASMTGCSTVSSIGDQPAAAAAKSAAPAPVTKPKVGSSYASAAPLGTVMSGTDMTNNPFTVSFGEVSWDASAAIHAANQFNDAPDAGQKFISVNVTVTNKGTQSSRVASELSFQITFMGPDGNTVSPTSKLAYLGSPLSSAPEIPAGGSVKGSLIYQVPAATATGAFVIDNLFESAK